MGPFEFILIPRAMKIHNGKIHIKENTTENQLCPDSRNAEIMCYYLNSCSYAITKFHEMSLNFKKIM